MVKVNCSRIEAESGCGLTWRWVWLTVSCFIIRNSVRIEFQLKRVWPQEDNSCSFFIYHQLSWTSEDFTLTPLHCTLIKHRINMMPIFFKGFEVVQGHLIHEFVSEFWLYSQNFFLWNSKRTKLFFFDVYGSWHQKCCITATYSLYPSFTSIHLKFSSPETHLY